MKMLLGISALLLIVSLGESANVRIGAWNLQNLGQSKMNKPNVVDVMVQVLRRYDIVSVLEVKDVNEQTPGLLLNALNNGLAANNKYTYALSQRVGRNGSSHHEQYAVYYKPSLVTFLKGYQYPDPTDRFEYDPYVVEFSFPNSQNLQRFMLISIHTKPRDAVVEINELANVYFGYRNRFNDVMFIGDFNAGCTYVRPSQWNQIALRTNPIFKWLIGDNVGTNVANRNCPYDRIVIAGNGLNSVTNAQSARAYYFNSPNVPASAVSDHYPVEVELNV